MYRVRTAWSGTAPGLPYLSTMYFNDALGATAQDAADAVRAFWLALQGLITNTLTATVEPDVAVVDSITGDVTDVLATSTLPVIGTNVADPIPWSSQGLIIWTTGTFINGRRVKGHTYIPGAGETSNTTGRPNSDYRPFLDSAAEALISDADSELVIWHRPKVGPPATPGSVAPVTSASVGTEWAVLRSRRQ